MPPRIALQALAAYDFPCKVRELRNVVERDALRQVVRDHSGNRRELARRLGLSERTLYRKMRGL